MIDPVQLPILMKAIDFVFEEGRKILEERRERRKINDASPDGKDQEPAKETIPFEVQESKEVKQDLLASKIDEMLWKIHEREVESLVKQLEKHTQNYYTLKEQFAEFGSAYAPPHIMSQMREREDFIIETRKRLESVLSKIYKIDLSLTK